MEISEAEYRKLVLEVAAARGHNMPAADAPAPIQKRGIVGRVWGLIVGLIWLALIGLVITVFAFAARVQYGIPIPLPVNMVSTAAITFSTAAAPLPTARQVQQQPMPIIVGAPAWPTLTPEAKQTPTPELAPDVAPIMAQPNLVPSKPGDNPGFSCGVEPGMDPNATCDPDEDAQSLSVPSVGERGSDKAGPGGGE